MRVLVLALAILLLPLRGWLGDAMAIEVVQSTVAATHATHAAHTMAADGHSMHESPDRHAATTHSAHHDASASPDCQSTCSDCQLCHSVALAVWPELTASVDVPRTAPAFAPAAFASAEPAPGFKPPIS